MGATVGAYKLLAAVTVVLLLAGCAGAATAPAALGTRGTEPTEGTTAAASPSTHASDAQSAPARGHPRKTSPRRDAVLVREFVQFANNPRERPFRWFRARVRLGLGPHLLEHRTREQLRSDSAWVLGGEDTLFRAYVGPFSALETVRRHVEVAATEGLHGSDAYTVRVGPHRHCASPPVPPPRGVRHLRRVALLPSPKSINDIGCLRWFSVDLFVDDTGKVHAITLDMWEP